MRTTNLAIAILLLAACKGKPTDHGGGPTAGSDDNSGSPAAAGPIVKTTAPLTMADYDRLTKLPFPNMKSQIAEETERVLEMRFFGPERPKLGEIARLSPCKDCVPIDLDKWKAVSETYRNQIPEGLRNLPDTTWELGETTVNGTKMIYTYALGTYWNGENTGNTGSFVDAYTLFYNDGINQGRFVAAYADDGVKSKDDLAKLMPRARLEQAAAQLASTFLAAW